MTGHPDDQRPPLGFLLVRIGEAVDQEFVAALADLGMKPRQLRLLVLVDRAGELSQGDLARQLGVDPGNLVGMLDELEREGLLTRARSRQDRRLRLVALTGAGRRLLKKALRATAAIDQWALDPLSTRQREAFYEAALAMHAALSRTARSGG